MHGGRRVQVRGRRAVQRRYTPSLRCADGARSGHPTLQAGCDHVDAGRWDGRPPRLPPVPCGMLTIPVAFDVAHPAPPDCSPDCSHSVWQDDDGPGTLGYAARGPDCDHRPRRGHIDQPGWLGQPAGRVWHHRARRHPAREPHRVDATLGRLAPRPTHRARHRRKQPVFDAGRSVAQRRIGRGGGPLGSADRGNSRGCAWAAAA